MKREYYEEEMMVKEAITSQKSDEEIGMPDVESELKRVKLMAKRNRSAFTGWQRIAAIITLVLSITGLTWAFVYYHQHMDGKAETAQQTVSSNQTGTNVTQPEDSIEVKASENITLSYDKASLEQIVVDLTAFYHLEQPEFENKSAARKYKMHITFDREASILDAVALLNQFGSIHIEFVDNKLVVK